VEAFLQSPVHHPYPSSSIQKTSPPFPFVRYKRRLKKKKLRRELSLATARNCMHASTLFLVRTITAVLSQSGGERRDENMQGLG